MVELPTHGDEAYGVAVSGGLLAARPGLMCGVPEPLTLLANSPLCM
jgi:hypothetical protein